MGLRGRFLMDSIEDWATRPSSAILASLAFLVTYCGQSLDLSPPPVPFPETVAIAAGQFVMGSPEGAPVAPGTHGFTLGLRVAHFGS